jgi:transposase-like protein
MARNQNTYSEAFKRELVELYETGDRSVRSLEREYDVGKGNLYRWRRKYGVTSQRQRRRENSPQKNGSGNWSGRWRSYARSATS